MPQRLKPYLAGATVIIGIGNRLRSDDGLGSIVAETLKIRLADNPLRTVIDAGVTPENYAQSIIRQKPDAVIIIDAVSFGGSPGQIEVLDARQVQTVNFFTTHNVSLSLFITYLQALPKTDMIVLGVEPKTTLFGEGLSTEAAQAARTIEEWLA